MLNQGFTDGNQIQNSLKFKAQKAGLFLYLCCPENKTLRDFKKCLKTKI